MALLAEGADRESVVTFGEAFTIGTGDQRAVIPGRRFQFQGAIQQNLPRRGLEEIGAADDFSDPHGGVIDDAGELVGRHTVAPPDEEIAEVAARNELLRTEMVIVNGDDFAVGNAEAPVETGGR